MRSIYPGPPPEAEVVSGIIEHQLFGFPLPDSVENPKILSVDNFTVAEQNAKIGELFLLAGQRSEERLQQIKPMPTGYYLEHFDTFVHDYTGSPAVDIADTNHIMLVGPGKMFDQVLPFILARRTDIVEITGIEPEKFIVFMGDGKTMEHKYRAIGSSRPPYSYAIFGALDCYINTDYFVDGRIETDAVRRAVWHEPAHVMWNSVLGMDITQHDMLLHEMLGGPLDPNLWVNNRAPIRELDSIPLLKGEVAFWDWFYHTAAQNGFPQSYFENPLTQNIMLRVQHVGYAELYRIAKERKHIGTDNFWTTV